jgi:hypothetical protein
VAEYWLLIDPFSLLLDSLLNSPAVKAEFLHIVRSTVQLIETPCKLLKCYLQVMVSQLSKGSPCLTWHYHPTPVRSILCNYITTVIEKLASILIAGVNQRTSASSTIFTSMKQVKLKLLLAPTCQVLIFSALRYCRERLDFSKPT